ncbi:hypothetical protein B0A55_09770 [Friedmanniomyces simplex]|uniref:Uncharacterized protein n=1 Tax=Friedmanniomyces simplex TaxID=329884 RepID=A0A4U0WKG8_9PEZI|nr:hypothetical protein B0A55_09770 [Friedmanniomyces simplex]
MSWYDPNYPGSIRRFDECDEQYHTGYSGGPEYVEGQAEGYVESGEDYPYNGPSQRIYRDFTPQRPPLPTWEQDWVPDSS